MADAFSLGNLNLSLTANTAGYVRGLATARVSLGRFTDAQGRVRNANGTFVAGLNQAGTAANGFGASLGSISAKMVGFGRTMSAFVTAPIVAMGIASVKSFGDFEDAMVKSLAIMDNVTPAMQKEMSDLARTMAKETTSTAVDLAKAYKVLGSSGLSAAQSQAALGTANNFALAGVMNLDKATEYLVDSQSALGLVSKDATQNMENMTRVADVLTKANAIASGEVEDFAAALTNKAASALKLLNKDVEEGVAVLAAYASVGVKGAGAGEKLNIVLRDLQNSALKNQDAFEAFGIQVFDADGNMKNMADIIGDLEGAMEGMSDESKRAALTLLGFQDRSVSGIMQLLGMSNAIRDNEKALRSASGATKELADKNMQTFNARVQILKNNITDLAIEVGQILVPYIEDAVKWVKEGVKWWGAQSEQTKKWIVQAAAAVAIIGPLVLGLGLLVSAGTSVITFLAAGVAGISGFTVALALVPAALLLVTDALLQFFGAGNLGLLDMINNFRLGGIRISTWMMTAALEVSTAWEKSFAKIAKGWEELKRTTSDVGADVMDQFTKNRLFVEHELGIITDSQYANMLNRNAAALGKEAQERDQAYTESLQKIDNDRNAAVEANDAAIMKIFKKDQDDFAVEKIAKELRDNSAGALDKALEKVVKKQEGTSSVASLNARQMTDARLMAGILKKLYGIDADTGGSDEAGAVARKKLDLSKLRKHKADAGDQSFSQEFSLNRFKFSGPGAVRAAQQEVTAPGTDSRLDKLINVVQNQNNVAVLEE